jgi:hypothetical protein
VDESQEKPIPEQKINSMNFNFRGNYADEYKISFQAAQEIDQQAICQYLDTGLLSGIRYEIFDTREGKQQADPNHSISRASARFDENAIYRFWEPTEDCHFPHEITHLVAHTWAKPYLLTEELDTADGSKINKTFEMVSTSFMQEGLAIAVDDIVFKRKLKEDGEEKFIDDWCREQIDSIPTGLAQVINLEGFGSIENKVVVPFAASLSKYLLQTYGVEKFKEMYVGLRETSSPEVNVKVIENVYGLSEDWILSSWRESLFK